MSVSPLPPSLRARLPTELLQNAFEEAVVGMMLCWPDKTGLKVNRAFSEFLGYTREELAQLGPDALVAPSERPYDGEVCSALLSGAIGSHRREKQFVHRDGRLLWTDFSCRLVRDREGQPEYFVAQVIDITERKRMERELQESQERFKSLCDLTSDWYWEQDAEFRFSRFFTSPGTPDSLARRVESLLGQRRWDMGMHALSCSWEEHKATLHAHLPYRNFEFGTLDGEDGLVISTSGEPQFAQDGRFLGYRGTSRDITVAKRAQIELDALNHRLEERVRERTRALELANRELEAFAYSIAHDLRAPMTAVGGFSRLLQRKLDAGDADSVHYLQRILSNVQRMSELTDALLSLAGLSGSEIEREPLDLACVAQELATDLLESSGHHRPALRVASSLPTCGNPRLLRQVMANLLANAWKFTDRTPAPWIEVDGKPSEDGASWIYHVRDNGVGFDMQYATGLFQPFRRLHAENEFPGTGIGLAVVRKIIERHGGTVWAEAAPGQGATFFFSLPAPT